MATIKKIALLVFLCSLPVSHATASQFPVNFNGWKLAALIPACVAVYCAASPHESHVLLKYDVCIHYGPAKDRPLREISRFLSTLAAVGCASAAGLLYYIGSVRQ